MSTGLCADCVNHKSAHLYPAHANVGLGLCLKDTRPGAFCSTGAMRNCFQEKEVILHLSEPVSQDLFSEPFQIDSLHGF